MQSMSMTSNVAVAGKDGCHASPSERKDSSDRHSQRDDHRTPAVWLALEPPGANHFKGGINFCVAAPISVRATIRPLGFPKEAEDTFYESSYR
jgi:hypothetical protein